MRQVQAPPRQGRQHPARGRILDILGAFGIPLFTEEISKYLRTRDGIHVPPAQIARILERDEQDARGCIDAHTGAEGLLCLCHAITAEHGESIARLIARSDWSLADRVVAATTGYVRHLKFVERLCEDAIAGRAVADTERYRSFIAIAAQGVPGQNPRWGEFKPAEWRAIATSALEEVEQEDARARADAAALLSKLAPLYQLYGRPEAHRGSSALPHNAR